MYIYIYMCVCVCVCVCVQGSKNVRGPKKCNHTLIEVIYGYNNKLDTKCNVWCVVLYSLKRWCWSQECQSHLIEFHSKKMAAERCVHKETSLFGISDNSDNFFFAHYDLDYIAAISDRKLPRVALQ
jgi:hypothetical protein